MMEFRTLLVVLMLGVAVSAEDPIYFADEALKQAVEERLNIEDPTATDMLSLFTLRAMNRQITSLEGLEYAENLRTLMVGRNELGSITPLHNLANLKWLDVSNNHVSDWSGVSALVNLEYINCHENGIRSLSPFGSLSKLKTLIVYQNQITSISELSGLVRLEGLNLGSNDIKDVSPLGGLAKLRKLDLSANDIVHLSPLNNLNSITELNLAHNKISDTSPLLTFTSLRSLKLNDNPLNSQAYAKHIDQIIDNNPNLVVFWYSPPSAILSIHSTAGGKVTQPGEGDIRYDIDVRVRLVAEPRPGFVFSHWSGSVTSFHNPLHITMNQSHEVRAHFISMRSDLYVNNGTKVYLNLMDNQAGEVLEDGSPDYPFDTIQEAIDVAQERASIYVNVGVYPENIDLLGKDVMLSGMDPNGPDQRGFPVIDGGFAGPVVTFAGGETADCFMTGFVITRGKGGQAGAIYCADSRPTLSLCLIVGNLCTELNSGSVYCLNSQPTFVNCTIADNVSGAYGAAVYLQDSYPTIINSILWDNRPREIHLVGSSDAMVSFTDLAGGFQEGQGGLLNLDPLFVRHGNWIEPEMQWIEGDYHLRSQAGRWGNVVADWIADQESSPCIDAGDPATSLGAEPYPHGDIVNLGAYGGTAEASMSIGK